MAKRAIRVVKWLGTTPAVAVCTACARNFNAPVDVLKSQPAAQDYLQKQFDQHKCEPLDSSQNAVRIVHEATDDK
jgi:heterodisulfide reductase subunit B